jgi:hypothetical protein
MDAGKMGDLLNHPCEAPTVVTGVSSSAPMFLQWLTNSSSFSKGKVPSPYDGNDLSGHPDRYSMPANRRKVGSRGRAIA